MSVEKKRLTSIKTDIETINTGMFIKQDGFTPSYVLTKTGQKLSRVRVLATVVDKFVSEDNKYASATLDDNTDTIRIKAFNSVSAIASVEKGNLIDVIGRIRIYNDEIYIIPEVIHKIDDPNMLMLRKIELSQQIQNLKKRKEIVLESQKKTSDFDELKIFVKKKYNINSEDVESILLSEEIPKTEEEKSIDKDTEKNKVIELIKKIDSGSGCEYSAIIKESGLSENLIEDIINELLSDGICFEPRPGVIKLL